ncbi:MAG: EAL domain-containing response regulator, partial [Steroidobacteraceae bacterium]
MLILESDPASKAVVCAVADRLGCERVEADSVESLRQILATRRPTIAVLAVDGVDTSCLAVLDALADNDMRPATLFVGSASLRVLASVKRISESRGLTVLGAFPRPLDAIVIEKLLAPHLAIAPPVLQKELQKAIEEQEFTLLYQPKLAIGSGTLTIQGVEALIRWQHPRRGLLPPRHFLKSIESFGLMSPLTDFVLTEAVRQGGQWRAGGLPLDLIINLSPNLVQDRGFAERLAILLHENDFPAQQLIFDVTESASTPDQDLVLDVFTRLGIRGVGLSLDNFGTGLSSLTELYRMPFSEIKVDHSLIAEMTRAKEARVIVKAIVDLAHALHMNACA